MKKAVIVTILVSIIITMLAGCDEPEKNGKDKLKISSKGPYKIYTPGEGQYFNCIVDNKDYLYAFHSADDDGLEETDGVKDLMKINKKDGSMQKLASSKFSGSGGLEFLMGNESYLAWVDNGEDSSELLIYDLKQDKMLRVLKDEKMPIITSVYMAGNKLYWLAVDPDEEEEGEEEDSLKVGARSSDIVSHDIKTGKRKVLDTIETVNYLNEQLAFSEKKIWYVDNRKHEEKAIIKHVDMDTGQVKTYPMKHQFLGGLKPINEHSVAFFKYGVDGIPMGLRLYNTKQKKETWIDKNEDDEGAFYNGRGLLVTSKKSYLFDDKLQYKINKDIQKDFYDQMFFSAIYPMNSVYFSTEYPGIEEKKCNGIVLVDDTQLKWQSSDKN